MPRSSRFPVGARPLGTAVTLPAVLLIFAVVARAQQPEIVVQSGHASPVNTVSFSPDGKLLASGSGMEWSFVEKNVVKLWDVATGAELRTLVHDCPVKWIGFSPDGRKVAAKGADGATTRVWDVASGAPLADLAAGPEYVSRDVTADGKVAAAIDGKNITLREVATARPLRTLASRTADFQKYIFSPDSTVLACGGDRFSIRLWDLRAGVLRTLVGHTDSPIVADFSPDSRLFASGGRDLSVRLWDVSSGREIKKLAGHAGQYVKGLHFSPDGKTLLSFDKAGFKLWDVATGRELVAAAGSHDDDFRRVIFNPRGDLLAASTDQGIKLWTAGTGQERHVLPGSVGSLDFSADGSLLLARDLARIGLWEVTSGKLLAAVDPSVQGADPWDVKFERAVFSPDSRTLAISEFDSRDASRRWRLYLHDAKTGKRLRTVDEKNVDPSGPLVFSADSKRIMNDGSGSKATWDVASGQRVQDFKQEAHFADSPNGVYRISFEPGGEVALHDVLTGGELASLIGIGETDWLVATSDGFFDGSPVAWKQIFWRFNNDTFNHLPLEAFFNEFYHPGLLQDVLAGKRPVRPDGKILSRIDRRQPQVTIVEAEPPVANQGAARGTRRVKLAVDITENLDAPAQADHSRSSGARDVRLFRNGSLVQAWRGDAFAPGANGGKPLATAAAKAKRVRYEISVPIVAGTNEFTAYAFNQANVKSADATLTVIGEESLRRPATLHVLAIGINQYENDRFNLRFAASDAREFAAEVKRQQDGLQNFGRVETTLLVDAQATKRNLLEALTTLAHTAQAEDTVIVYFAGHGVAQRDQFYLIPHDLGYADAQARIEGDGLESLLRHGISDRELERALERVDAAQLLLVVDACNSGQALEAEEKRRGPMNSKGLAQLAYEKGISVLTAAQSYQAAREVSKLGHGLLTYVLVEEGLRQAAADADPKDNQILLHEWLDYATRRVPQVQVPKIARDRGTDPALDGERALIAGKREAQRPRVFYRRENEASSLVLAHAATPASQVPAETATATRELRPLAVAVADRTVMDQPLPKAIKQQWRAKFDSLVGGDSLPIKRVNDPADADWLIQVAALERTDIIYLAPSKKLVGKSHDALLRMSPPGDEAIAWLKAELERVARAGSDMPSPDEAADEGDDRDRAILGLFHKGPAEDLKAEIVQEQSGVYHTPNRTQAVLGTYGKMIEGNRLLGHLPRFEHRGIMQHFDRVRRFTTVQRQGRGSGNDFVSLVGNRQAWQVVELTGQASAGRQNEVTFEIVGVRLDQTDAIKALNADADALNYFDYVSKNKEVPCLILENLVFTSYAAAQNTTVNLGAKAKTALTGDGAAAGLQTQRTTFTQFTSPIVRCYQMYQVKLHQNRVVELVVLEP